MLTSFQVVCLQELVLFVASCLQANRLVKVKGILTEVGIAVSSRRHHTTTFLQLCDDLMLCKSWKKFRKVIWQESPSEVRGARR